MIRPTLAVAACLLTVAAIQAARCEETPGWKYDVVVTAPGSRSESRTGILTHAGAPVLPYFTEVVTPIGHYVFSPRRSRWGDAGWLAQEGKPPQPETLDEKIAAEELERGWYLCKPGTMKADTPPSWLWTPTLSAWIDPAKLDVFIKDRFTKADWSYEVKQAESGMITTTLAYKGTPVPASVGRILTPIGEFYVPPPAHMLAAWLVRSGDCLEEVPSGTNALDEQTIAAGVFDEDPEMLDVAIPEHWVYLPDKRWWIDPAKITEYFRPEASTIDETIKIGPKQ